MIKYLYVNNYKSFVNFKIQFEKNNLLLGENGTGKSNLLQLIAYLCSFVRDTRYDITTVFNADTCTRWMSSKIQSFELCLEINSIEYVYRLEVEHDIENSLSSILKESLHADSKTLVQVEKGDSLIYNDMTQQLDRMISNPTYSVLATLLYGDKRYKSLDVFRECVSRIFYCSPDPRQMIEVVENNVYYPTFNMSNMASLYTGLVEILPDFQFDFTKAMKEISPAYVGAYSSLSSFPKTLAVHYKYKDVSISYKLNELSDGEKILFAMYMVIYGYLKQGYTVLLDEPDNYLGLREIQPWCIELEDILFDNGQCILVSHHPEVIDYFTDSSGIWISRLPSGESTVRENPFVVPENGEILSYSELIASGMDVNR